MVLIAPHVLLPVLGIQFSLCTLFVPKVFDGHFSLEVVALPADGPVGVVGVAVGIVAGRAHLLHHRHLRDPSPICKMPKTDL